MALVAVQCTKCGGKLTVDNSKSSATCQFCGTDFLIEQAQVINHTVNNFTGANVTVAGVNVNNLVRLATNALNMEKYDQAFEYAMKAIEENIECSDAWMIIAICSCGQSIELTDMKVINNAIENAFRYSTDKQTTYKMLLDIIEKLIYSCIPGMKNVASIYAMTETGQKTRAKDADTLVISMSLNRMGSIIALRKLIPEEEIEVNQELFTKCMNIHNIAFSEYTRAVIERKKIYGAQLNHFESAKIVDYTQALIPDCELRRLDAENKARQAALEETARQKAAEEQPAKEERIRVKYEDKTLSTSAKICRGILTVVGWIVMVFNLLIVLALGCFSDANKACVFPLLINVILPCPLLHKFIRNKGYGKPFLIVTCVTLPVLFLIGLILT